MDHELASGPPRYIAVVGAPEGGIDEVATAIVAGLVANGSDPQGAPAAPAGPGGLDDRMLAALGCAWDAPWSSPPPDLLGLPSSLDRELADWVAATEARGVPVAADPRISLLLPWWRRVLGERLVVVVVVRDAIEVVARLVDRLAVEPDVAVALWESYQRSLVAALDGASVVTVRHAALARKPGTTLAALGRAFKRLGVRPAFDAGAAADALEGHGASAGAGPAARGVAIPASAARLGRLWPAGGVVLLDPCTLSVRDLEPRQRTLLELQWKARGSPGDALVRAPATPGDAVPTPPPSAPGPTSRQAPTRPKASAARRRSAPAARRRPEHVGDAPVVRAEAPGPAAEPTGSPASNVVDADARVTIAELREETRNLQARIAEVLEVVRVSATVERSAAPPAEPRAPATAAATTEPHGPEDATAAAHETAVPSDGPTTRPEQAPPALPADESSTLPEDGSSSLLEDEVERLRREASDLEAELGAVLYDRELHVEVERTLRDERDAATARALAAINERDQLEELLAEARRDVDALRAQVAILDAARDELLHILIRNASSGPGRFTAWWQEVSRRHPVLARAIGRPAWVAWQLVTLRWPRWVRVNPLFDHAWFVSRYPEAPRGRRMAYRYYRRHGARASLDANRWFETAWYLARNPDIARSGVDPLDHYLLHGWREGRDPGPRFDGFEYLRHHPEVAARGQNPLLAALRESADRPASTPETPPAASAADAGLAAPTADAAPTDRSLQAQGLVEAAHVEPTVGAAASADPQLPSPLERAWTYYRRQGMRRFVQRVADELRPAPRGPEPPHIAFRRAASPVNAHRVHAHLDSPVSGAAEGSDTLLVTGWACAAAGIESIDVYVDGVPAGQATTGDSRPDVAALHPRIGDAATSGFSVRVRIDWVEAGTHLLEVAIHDRASSTRALEVVFERTASEVLYHRFFVRSSPSAEETARLAALAAERRVAGIRLFIGTDEPAALGDTLRSLVGQRHPDWHATVVCGSADEASVRATVSHVGTGAADGRIAVASGELPDLVASVGPGSFVGFLAAGETLADQALLRLAIDGATADVDVVYSDHDSVEPTGRHVDPWFVPDWSPDHELAHDYVGGFYLLRRTSALAGMVADAGAAPRAAWRYDLLLRASERSERIRHVPAVLWSSPATRQRDPRLDVAELAVARDALRRRGGLGEASMGERPGVRRVTWPLRRPLRVTIIVPTTGRLDLVRPCVESIRARTTYPDYELLFIDNSRGADPGGIAWLRREGVRVLECDEPFNWARLSNMGARAATGELLLFLNDDVEITDGDWLTELAQQAARPGIGAVGAQLLFPDGTIQHAGVVLVNRGGGAMHLLHRLDPRGDAYLDLQWVTREVTAVTGACLMVLRSRFNEVGGFDERLEIVGNDIDLCLRLARRGYRTLYAADSRLIHHESKSRASISYTADEGRVWERWGSELQAGDPYLNPNLASDRPDCAIDWSRVEGRPDLGADADAGEGVNLVGYVHAEMGLGQAIRGDAQALAAARVPFLVIDYRHGNPSRMTDRSWSHVVRPEPHYDTNIIHINADALPRAIENLPPGLLEGRYTIGIWAWELPEFPDAWVRAFGLVDEVWAPSEFVRQAIAAKAPVPVVRMPHAVLVPRGPFLGRSAFGLTDGPFQFLAMYDVNSVQERKNPRGTLEAFLRAFDPDDQGVRLVVKVNNADEREARDIGAMVAGRRNVHVIDRVLTRHEVDSLMACSDSFVSLHRSEGFGLPIAEAMGLGRPVIATWWSGNVDFMDPDIAACVGYQLVTLDRDHGPYRAGQRWADPDLDDAAAWMRRLREHPEAAARMAAAGRQRIVTRFSPEAVGRQMERRLREIRGAEGRPGDTGRDAPVASATAHRNGHATGRSNGHPNGHVDTRALRPLPVTPAYGDLARWRLADVDPTAKPPGGSDRPDLRP